MIVDWIQDGHFAEVTVLRAKRSLGCEESDRSTRRTITFREVIVLHIERSLWFEESDRFATRTITLYKVIVLNSERSLFVHIRGFAVCTLGFSSSPHHSKVSTASLHPSSYTVPSTSEAIFLMGPPFPVRFLLASVADCCRNQAARSRERNHDCVPGIPELFSRSGKGR